MYKVILRTSHEDVQEKATRLRNALGIPMKDACDLVALGGCVMRLQTEHAAVTLRDSLVDLGLPASIQVIGDV